MKIVVRAAHVRLAIDRAIRVVRGLRFRLTLSYVLFFTCC